MRPIGGWSVQRQAVIWLTLLGTAGCESRGFLGTPSANLRPMVVITEAPRSYPDPSSYVAEISWTGSDEDGRVVGFRYSIDPPSRAASDTAWTSTASNRVTLSFSADSLVGGHGRRLHTFVVEAVDDRGLSSAPAHVSFDATTIAPTIRLLSPTPHRLLTSRLTSSFRASWMGSDPDGSTSRAPESYRWRLFGSSTTPSFDTILSNPDTLMSLFAPSFTGWDSLPGTQTSVALRDLTPGQFFVFAVVAIDEAGAWSPVASLDENLLQFYVEPVPSGGPKVTLASESFAYTFPTGGVQLDVDFWPGVDFADGVPITIRWDAQVTSGAFLRGMRWAVDIESVTDETPRSDEATDLRHWSQRTLEPGIVIRGLDPPQGASIGRHLLYLEVEDDIGQLTLVGLRMTVVRPSFERPLLIVDDTFFLPDRIAANGCTAPPSLTWPTAAELDTFLFAAGGVPWRCYPQGTQSTPGLFAGYDFDTLGTHTLRLSDFTLSELSRYRNIIWMVDGASAAGNNGVFNTLVQPMPMFRYLAQPGTYNPLTTWVRQGGRLWLMGGGASYASLRDFDLPGTASNVFSNMDGELVPGRFMYDQAHWRSETQTWYSRRAQRSERAIADVPGQPDYSLLPAELREKSSATDPLPPLRSASAYYSSSYFSEHLTSPNAILEPAAGGTFGDSVYSTLDTLYETQGGVSGTGYPVMTIYHGSDHAESIFSGFPIWYFQRSQAIEVVDFVLQRLWGIPRRAVPR